MSSLDIPVGQAARSEMVRGVRTALPVMLGFVPFALVLGAQAQAKGMNPLEVMLLTGLNFAGGSEFAAVGLWTSPPHLALLAGVTLLINSRHILMSMTLAPYLGVVSLRRRLIMLGLMCDETWALGIADVKAREARGETPCLSPSFYMGVAIALYVTWIVMTGLGAMMGPVLGDITRFGFDMAFPAVFLVLLRGMWPGARAAAPWVISGVIAVGVYLLVPGAWYVPAGAVAGVAAAWFWGRSDG